MNDNAIDYDKLMSRQEREAKIFIALLVATSICLIVYGLMI